jgi:hypothetical protein
MLHELINLKAANDTSRIQVRKVSIANVSFASS